MRVAPVLLVLVFLAASAPAAEPAAEPEPPKKPPAERPAAPPKKPAGEPKKPGLFDGEKPEEIIVTGSRLATEEKHEGASVAVVTGRELELRRPTAAWEAVALTPGVTFVQSGTAGQETHLFMRGGESNHTMVLLDGFKINDAGGEFAWETLTPAGAGRVEVLRGAGSALYGAEAMTGVVQVFTERGAGLPRLGLSAEAGNRGTFRETSQLVGEDGPLAYNLNLSRFDLTDGRMPNSDVRSTTFAGRLDWETPSGLHAELVTHTMAAQIGNYESDDIRDPNGRVEHGRELLGLVLSGRIADRVDSRLLLGHLTSSFFYKDDLDAADTIFYRTKKDLERLSADWQNDVQLYELGPAKGTLTVGVAWEQEAGKIDAFADGTYLGLPYQSESFIDRSRWARAAYAQKRLELWEALTLEAGVRTEDHSTFGTKTTTRAAAALWIERTGTKLHSSWGQGLKSPDFFENFDDSFYDLGGVPTNTVGNPDLKPEKVTSVDAGVEQHLLADAAVAGVTVFRNRFEDFINFQFGFPTSTYVNAGRAEAEGVEYELALKPVKWARARGTFTVTHTRASTDAGSINFEDGHALLRRPERVATGVVEFEPLGPWPGAPEWARRLSLFGELVHQAGSVDVDWTAYERVNLPSFTELNVGFNWEIWKADRHSLRLFARWENVTDVEIEQAAGITGTPSSFLGGVGYTMVF